MTEQEIEQDRNCHYDLQRLNRWEIAACLRLLGESHLNTLLGKFGLAAILDQAGKQSEAIDTRRDVAKTCLSLDGKALAAVREVMERLIPHLQNTEDRKLSAGIEEQDEGVEAGAREC